MPPHPSIQSIAVRVDCYICNMTRPRGHLARSISIDCDTPCQPAVYRYGHAGIQSDRSCDVLLVVLFAIVIIPAEELTNAECGEVFGAGATGDVRHANPSTATVSQVEEAFGQFLVPQPVPPGLTLNARRVEGQVAYVEYRGAAAEGWRVPTLTIEQGPTGGQAWQIHAKEGYFSQETVGGASALFVRGGLVIRARIVDGVETIDCCGWDPDEENSLVFVANGHAVRIAGSPASEFPPGQLRSLAASLIDSQGGR